MNEQILNKSFMTNFTALSLLVFGLVWSHQGMTEVGLFAFSGGFTNWIAIHMLFERVPGFYGSGVIQNRFEDFKKAIEKMVMQEFFSAQNIMSSELIDFKKIIGKLPLDKAFDALLEAVSTSSLGTLLNMVGGIEALRPMQPVFEERLRKSLEEISETTDLIPEAEIRAYLSKMVKHRLDQLTPMMVKDLMQTMIRQHLGWLVVWGGVFGGMIGLFSYFIKNLS